MSGGVLHRIAIRAIIPSTRRDEAASDSFRGPIQRPVASLEILYGKDGFVILLNLGRWEVNCRGEFASSSINSFIVCLGRWLMHGVPSPAAAEDLEVSGISKGQSGYFRTCFKLKMRMQQYAESCKVDVSR
jgi:hypothetical protein